MKAANQVTDHLTIEDTVVEEDLSDTYLSTIHTCFNLGFEVSSAYMYYILYNYVAYLFQVHVYTMVSPPINII